MHMPRRCIIKNKKLSKQNEVKCCFYPFYLSFCLEPNAEDCQTLITLFNKLNLEEGAAGVVLVCTHTRILSLYNTFHFWLL